MSAKSQLQKTLRYKRKNYYFAYGSNMNFGQMKQRCKNVKHAGQADMPGWAFIINERGVANIVRDDESVVEGCLWEVTDYHLDQLDLYEGAKFYQYSHVVAPVASDIAGRLVKAHMYIDFCNTTGNFWPKIGYGDKVFKGAVDNGLSLKYIEELKKTTEEQAGS